jgi:peptidoglycan/LPS O-acetylase OafA/YrhL
MLKTNSENYRPDIDGLRALAVLPVLLFHAKLGCPGGFVGVDVFFVISGYLISSLILKEQRDGTFSLVNFWERRIRRILPALAVVVLASLIAGWILFLPEDLDLLGRSVVAQAALISNVFFYRQGLMGGGYFAPASDTRTLLHTWSLAVEEQFYLLFPLLLIFLARHRRPSPAKTLSCLAVASFALSVAGSYLYPLATFYLLPSRAWELLTGALLAVMHGRLPAGRRTRETTGWAGLILIGYAVCFYDHDTRFPGLAAIPPCLGAALVIFSSETNLSFAGRMLALKPVVFIGLISYSLYLWHWPVLVFSGYFFKYLSMTEYAPGAGLRATLLLASAGLAILSWKYIETPFRKRWIFQKRPHIFGFAGASLAILLILGLFIFHAQGVPSRFTGKTYSYVKTRNHQAFRNEISLEQAIAGHFIELGSGETNRPINILIWGDSHAMAVTPVIDELCRRYSWRGIQATHSATAPILGYANDDKFSLLDKTPVFASAVLDFIAKNHVKNVILVGIWSSYLTSDLSKTQILATARAITNTGAKLYVLKDVPMQDHDLPRLIAVAALHNIDLDQVGVVREQYQIENRELNQTFAQISEGGATVLDPAGYFLNSKGLYGVVKNNQILYCDYHHLTVEGAELLAPLFEPIFHTN